MKCELHYIVETLVGVIYAQNQEISQKLVATVVVSCPRNRIMPKRTVYTHNQFKAEESHQ